MNARPSGLLTVDKAIDGFLSFKNAEGMTERTIDSYRRILEKWVEYLGETTVVNKVSSADITKYLGWLHSEYTPHRFGKGDEPLSPKTLRNVWVILSSFFTWASKEF